MKKSRKPSVDLDALNLKMIVIDEVECNELRGHEVDDNRPISEIAMKVAVDLKQGKPYSVYIANANMISTVRRMLLYDLGRIVAGGDKEPRCLEHGNELTFSYVKTK